MPSPKLMTSVAARAAGHRKYLFTVGLVVPVIVVVLYAAIDFASAGRVPSVIRVPLLAALFAVPVHWVALVCMAWFDPDRGVLRQRRGAWLGWPAAVFLSLVAAVSIVGPLLVFAL